MGLGHFDAQSPFRQSLKLERGSLDIKLDVTETDSLYKVCADLPGVKKEDINVRIDGNLVQIDAQAKQENPDP